MNLRWRNPTNGRPALPDDPHRVAKFLPRVRVLMRRHGYWYQRCDNAPAARKMAKVGVEGAGPRVVPRRLT